MTQLTPAMIILAPFVGSFAALVADRMPRGETVVFGRSRCDSCRRVLAPFDLLPLLSYAVLRGRARCCGAPLDLRLPVMELLALSVPVAALAARTEGVMLVASSMLGWTLLVLAAIDRDTLTLPDALTLPLAAVGLALSASGLTGPLPDHLTGALLGYGAIAGIGWFYRRIRGIDGIGMGDAKLLAAAGAWVGATGLPSVLMIACGIGLASAILARPRMRIASKAAIPFGPPLAIGFWMTWLAGPVIWTPG